MGQPVVHFEVIGGADEVPGAGIVIGLLQDFEGHVIGLMSPAGPGVDGLS